MTILKVKDTNGKIVYLCLEKLTRIQYEPNFDKTYCYLDTGYIMLDGDQAGKIIEFMKKAMPQQCRIGSMIEQE